jgi:DnaJ-class molecular chaperone
MMMEDFYIPFPDPVQIVPPVKKAHSHYEILKVARTASAADIRLAYRRLVSEYHPDRNQSPSAATVTQRINKAYQILSKPESRAEHDVWIVWEERRLNPPRPAYTAQAAPARPKPAQTQNPASWNPEHADAFTRFIQKVRADQSSPFAGYSIDHLYSVFLDQRPDDQIMRAEEMKDEAMKVMIKGLCCTVALLLITAYLGYSILIAQ